MINKGAEICLIVVFNHKYEENIPKLRSLYKSRFTNIFFLMPFYQGNDDDDVIPVYEDSRYFQGFFRQAFHRYYNPDKYSHYVFVADDLLLNPKINERNILTELNLDDNSGFIRNLSNLNKLYYLYIHLTGAMDLFGNIRKELKSQLPSPDVALKYKEKYGLKNDNLKLKNLRHWDGGIKLIDFIKYKGFWKAPFFLFKTRQLPYPLVSGYSDLTIIPSNAIKEFTHLCGIMAAINLWVEFAIPTAMILSCKTIKTELAYGENFFSEKCATASGWKGTLLFNKNKLIKQEEKFNYDLTKLYESYREKELYKHPIKLSKWNKTPDFDLKE